MKCHMYEHLMKLANPEDSVVSSLLGNSSAKTIAKTTTLS